MAEVKKAHYFGRNILITTTSMMWNKIILLQPLNQIMAVLTSADVESETNVSNELLVLLLTAETKIMIYISK